MCYIEIYIQNKNGLLITATVRTNAPCDSHCHLKTRVHGVAYQWINVFMVVFLIVEEMYFSIMVVLFFFRTQFPLYRSFIVFVFFLLFHWNIRGKVNKCKRGCFDLVVLLIKGILSAENLTV